MSEKLLDFIFDWHTMMAVIETFCLLSIGLALVGDVESAYILLALVHCGLLIRLSSVKVNQGKDGL